MSNLNILSQRYATPEMNKIFSEKNKISLERNLWIAVMKAQKRLGVEIPSEEIEKYERAKKDINIEEIEEIERKTKHDVKAKIEGFVKVAGAEEHIHKGMTSRDLTDNVEQIQIKQASQLIFGKYISILRHMRDKSKEYKNLILTARTHHQPAQPTLFGRRIAMWAEELLVNLRDFERFIQNYPLRGIKGPVGTQSDMLKLLGSKKKVNELERMIAKELGFKKVLSATGQVYPRSLDYKLIANLSLIATANQNFSKGIRLMAGYELVTEGFQKGQVGSSAMPHKMNTRNSERINGFSELLKMYSNGASRLAGDQWEEGDVSCSVIRRVIIPDSFYASDGICETTLTVLNQMGAYPRTINQELDKYLPFLATTQILMIAVKRGLGREKAHEIIKHYTVKEALSMKEKGKKPQVLERLAEDENFKKVGITKELLHKILKDKKQFIGNAKNQINKVNRKINYMLKKYPEEAEYEPLDIL